MQKCSPTPENRLWCVNLMEAPFKSPSIFTFTVCLHFLLEMTVFGVSHAIFFHLRNGRSHDSSTGPGNPLLPLLEATLVLTPDINLRNVWLRNKIWDWIKVWGWAQSDVKMAWGTGASASLWNKTYETKLGWEQIKDGNVRKKQTQEGIKEGRRGWQWRWPRLWFSKRSGKIKWKV